MKRADIKKVKKAKENPFLISLVEMLNKEKRPIWKKIAYELSRPRRSKIAVNVSKIDEFGKDGCAIVVPGKVLGAGRLSKKVIVAAFAFSAAARQAIEHAGGKAVSIEAVLKTNPTGRDIMILK
ncbi:MAG: 50S ribosomal protein L18e [Candidatus Bilamarchaeaceae archaeon]